MPITVRPGWVIPDDELSWRFSRSSGPGGQGVNTTDSRVELSYDPSRSRSLAEHSRYRDRVLAAQPSTITVTAQEHRSQLMNRDAAARRLAALLRDLSAPPPPPRRATRPSRGAVERRVAAKKRRGDVKRLRGRADPD